MILVIKILVPACFSFLLISFPPFPPFLFLFIIYCNTHVHSSYRSWYIYSSDFCTELIKSIKKQQMDGIPDQPFNKALTILISELRTPEVLLDSTKVHSWIEWANLPSTCLFLHSWNLLISGNTFFSCKQSPFWMCAIIKLYHLKLM